MVCTFFGHKDTPGCVESLIGKVIVDLIEHDKVNLFYVGNNGNFDFMVHRQLRIISEKYPIRYYIVKSYIDRKEEDFSDAENVIAADGTEGVPLKFAISNRNRWKINQSDCVITYVEHISSGAYKFKKLAQSKGLKIIELYK